MFDAPKYGVISTNLKYRLEKDLITEKNNLRGEGKDDGSTMIPVFNAAVKSCKSINSTSCNRK